MSQEQDFYDDDFDEAELEEERLMTIENELRTLIGANAAAIKNEGDARALLAASVASNTANLMSLGTDIVTMRGSITSLTTRLGAINADREIVEFKGIAGQDQPSVNTILVGTRFLRNYWGSSRAANRPLWLFQDYPSRGVGLARTDRLLLVSRDHALRADTKIGIGSSSTSADIAIGIELFNVDVGSATSTSQIATKVFTDAGIKEKLAFSIAKYFADNESELLVSPDAGFTNQVTSIQSVLEDFTKQTGSETWSQGLTSAVTYQFDGGAVNSRAFGTLWVYLDVSATGIFRLITSGHRAIRVWTIQ